MKDTQLSAVAKFRALHESGCFVLPNPWDVGTAIYLEYLGFKALATTSAGFAFSRAPFPATRMRRLTQLRSFSQMAPEFSLKGP